MRGEWDSGRDSHLFAERTGIPERVFLDALLIYYPANETPPTRLQRARMFRVVEDVWSWRHD